MKPIVTSLMGCLLILVGTQAYYFNLTANPFPIQGWIGFAVAPVSILMAFVLGMVFRSHS